MTTDSTVLLIAARPETADAVRAAFGIRGSVQLTVAHAGPEALALARAEKPDLILIEDGAPAWDVAALCHSLRAGAAGSGAEITVLTDPGAGTLRAAALSAGANDVLDRPPAPAEMLARLETALRLKRSRERLRVMEAELEQARATLARRLEQTLLLLQSIVDMGLPGATDRTRQISELTERLAARFGIPEGLRGDLAIAARLHEIGRVVSPAPHAGSAQTPADAWQYTVPTRAILRHVEGLEGAAEMVKGMFENWDGTGFPDHLRQGQIPLRCRILRTAADFFAALEGPRHPTAEAVLADLGEHVGTRYDPMVIVHLRALLQGAPEDDLRGARAVLPIPELHVGMVLAEDLYTDSGLKLLARETVLSAPLLETIQRRHRMEPILQGATVRRGRAA